MRVLVIGGEIPGINCESVDWQQPVNIKDYETIFINLNSILEQAESLVAPGNDIPQSVEFPSATDIMKIFRSGNRVYIFLPKTRFIDLVEVNNGDSENIEVDLLSWLPFKLDTVEEEGISVNTKTVAKNWEWYFDKNFDWPMYIRSVSLRDDQLTGQTPFDLAKGRTIAETAFSESIASAVTIRPLTDVASQFQDSMERNYTGEVYLLPLQPGYEFSEVAAKILSEIHGLSISLKEQTPQWAQNRRLPRQHEIYQEWQKLRDEFERLDHYQKLLYAKGDELEQVVLQAFEELGLETEPEVSGKRDGLVWIDDTVFVLETYGTENAVSIGKVDQLDRWVRNVRDEYGDIDVRGLLVANTYCRQPPEDRDEGLVGDPKAELQDYGYRFLETLELYNALAQQQQKNVQITDIRENLLDADLHINFS
ncbi:hypothetical protein [Natronoglomus mannanivorans]|uniref:Uncharacterized protein n=1 Tax=Natronoglomus mannanivorans TaxID=2979990 RepID=A0AAP2YWZ8_9EURY|nr:hypothetical protein [Halobacteria archaeon AArc-xg1-1]